MFKKPFADLKTIAPLRTSDRRKLKQRVLETFKILQPEEGDVLVPEGLHWQKFTTYADEPGIVYLSIEGDPLWFTIGKDSDELIPTVYTLWKRPNMLPLVSTPAAVIPKLVNGADLMIPGVVQYSTDLTEGQLVSITQYHGGKIGYPLAVGQMAVPGNTIAQAEQADVKGKAVYVLHAWKDALWEMGHRSRAEVPDPLPENPSMSVESSDTTTVANNGVSQETDTIVEQAVPTDSTAAALISAETDLPALTAEDVTNCLRSAVLQAIASTLASLPPSAFPMPASTFWSSYILPARPYHAPGTRGSTDASAVDVKRSTYKSVKAFLKAMAKEGLIKLKDSKGGDVLVTAVFPKHPAVAGHQLHRSVKDVETKQQRAEDRERKEKEAEEKRKGEIQVTELWKPFEKTLNWFVAADKETSELYTMSDIKTTLNEYVSAKNLINAQEQQYLNVSEDSALLDAVTDKNETDVEFLKREEVLTRIRNHMQSWYEIRVEGKDVVRKKGQLKAIQVVVKVRQGRKACTFVTGFEPFKLNADDLADDLRKLCASSTSVAPVPGKGSDMEVMIQGKQIKTVTDLLIGKGVPTKWIESSELKAKKK
ncbi:uncharacterized protein FIBRA_03015 [Fibroporia radiculosa]|uniref:SUI1 domain-containing protein n=1 Tax=Fibroporia radiculosa TaxID=599839 RepID=J4HVR4_9APHY|nr:uncharacterized protein FIBRA_03015 [Fibroporia radiculosa]CCM00967.1 predicted protein [Fibroporia radiculosa]